jgi:hypothetical protein
MLTYPCMCVLLDAAQDTLCSSAQHLLSAQPQIAPQTRSCLILVNWKRCQITGVVSHTNVTCDTGLTRCYMEAVGLVVKVDIHDRRR